MQNFKSSCSYKQWQKGNFWWLSPFLMESHFFSQKTIIIWLKRQLNVQHLMFQLSDFIFVSWRHYKNHKNHFSETKDWDKHKTLSSCCFPQRMSGMFTIQKCRKQFNKYLSRILWGPASAGLLSHGQIWILCKSVSLSTQNRWRSNNVQRLCWHCQLTSGKQNKSQEHVKTRAECPRERSENIPFIKRPLSASIGQVHSSFYWPQLVSQRLINVSLTMFVPERFSAHLDEENQRVALIKPFCHKLTPPPLSLICRGIIKKKKIKRKAYPLSASKPGAKSGSSFMLNTS